ncbi:hypothetical protein QBC42DRAFT_300185 [Cladorrhinum samala]|uniref:EamA domain-containing protein n=1 Tax=Cladorrhinum samala TaxID=585594 RepID=A0AAV9HFG8_9PEZI|nr:hypothetical protein QBC42DRAFT_300185 [Cladorrhinum samala]
MPSRLDTHPPLLYHSDSDDDGSSNRGRRRPSSRPPQSQSSHTPILTRRSTADLRSRSPGASASARLEARRKYTYASFFLVTSLVSFTVQTELSAHIQHDLKWEKAYCMMYLTHGSWVFLFPLQLLFLRMRRREQSWKTFWLNHLRTLRTTAQMVQRQDLLVARAGAGNDVSPWSYLIRTTALVSTALTVAGLSWYVAVSMTTPSDLTAIYNCNAFFAYAFSVPLLKERLRPDKMLAVGVAILGVMVVAYGDGNNSSDAAAGSGSGSRFAGNIIIGIGSVLYGLYEVLYKRLACPPDGASANRKMMFANTFGSLIGAFTLLVLWIPLPILHLLGWEKFELPSAEAAWLLFISVVANMVFSGSFLVLISLTGPVVSSVAALLTIFIVAIVDWTLTGQPLGAAAVFGGFLIIVAFGMLSWSTWKEMNEEEKRKQVDISSDSGDDD